MGFMYYNLSYAESTSGALMYLSLEAANIRSISADHIASHIGGYFIFYSCLRNKNHRCILCCAGKAQGICLLLRGMPHHFSNRRSYLPLDITAKVCFNLFIEGNVDITITGNKN